MKSLYVILVSLFVSCSLYAQSTLSGTILHDNLVREYSMYVPAVYDGTTPVPLLLNLHGYGSNNLQQQFYGDFRSIADTANFIIVHPNGTEYNGSRFWNVGFFPSTVDDLGFLLALVDSLSQSYNIDPKRIYSTGMSNGGFMSYELACHSDRIAAIASVTGSMTTIAMENCTPTRAIPALEMHGTADPTVPYNGATGMLGIEQVVNYWVTNNNCSSEPTVYDITNSNETDGATAQRFVYSGGSNGSTVEFYKIQNGGHTWPGAAIVIGTTCMDFSASREIWRFLSQYDRDGILGYEQLSSTNTTPFSLAPNPAANVLQFKSAQLFEQIEICNIQGQKVITYLPTSTECAISVEQLPRGNYYLRAIGKGHTYTQKWVKQ